jgi:phosphatidylserine decarboxylase
MSNNIHNTNNIPEYNHPILAKEGWPILAIAIVVNILVYQFIGGVSAFICFLFLIFSVQFFRDPKRSLPKEFNENSVVSPADGQVVHIGEELNSYTNKQSLKISVFMNVFNVHSNRAPIAGNIKHMQYFAGKFLNAAVDKASSENERNAIILQTSNNQEITFVQIAGLVARRIICYAKQGESLYAGQRYGFIRFGSRVDVYLPLGSEIKVQLGQKVSATSTLLAQIK